MLGFARLALESAEEAPNAEGDDSDEKGPDTRSDENRQAEGKHDDRDQPEGSKGGEDDTSSDGPGEGSSDNACECSKNHLRVPFLAVEYKKASGDEHQGVNQLRVYNTALSKYLAHLGVRDFPTFGLVTDGAMGFVTCTFTPSEFEKDVWLDRDASVYKDYGYTVRPLLSQTAFP